MLFKEIQARIENMGPDGRLEVLGHVWPELDPGLQCCITMLALYILDPDDRASIAHMVNAYTYCATEEESPRNAQSL